MLRLTFILWLLPVCQLFSQRPTLYNGSEYTSFYHGFGGHPNLLSDSLSPGEIFYDGILFTGISLGYNIADDKVFVRNEQEGYNLQLVGAKISWFIIAGRRFVNLPASGGFSHGFYELLYNGHVRVFAARRKKLKKHITSELAPYFVTDDHYYVETAGKLTPVEDVETIAAAFSVSRDEIKKIARSENLHIRKNFEVSLESIADHFEKNTIWKEKIAVKVQQRVDERPVIQKIPALDENRIFEIGSAQKPSAKSTVTLAGYIKDAKTGESIIAATVSAGNTSVITDQFGYYALTLPKGRHEIRISSSGMNDAHRQIILNEDGKLDVELSGMVASLRAVVVVAEKNSNVKNTQMSVEKLAIQTIRQVPVVFGEADVLRVLTTLPGVSSAGEAGTGFNVRGGSVDQNLILFSDATIYNPSHVFGFFSAFNPDLVKAVELYKSAIPEKFGGRLSSVLDVSVREGNNKKISGSAGIGPLSSKITIEGPIFSEKTTFIAGIRTTYSNWVLRSIRNDFSESRASFYDANLNIDHKINNKNDLYLTMYSSNDGFRLNNDTSYQYGNRNWNIKWKHIFNNKIYMVVTGGNDRYEYSVKSKMVPENAFRLGFRIRQTHFRTDFTYSPSNNHQLSFGFNSIYHELAPGTYSPNAEGSLVVPRKLQSEQALESAVYLGDKYSVTSNLSVSAGVRYSFFNYLGPYNVYQYTPGVPRDTSTLSDSIYYRGGKVIKTYQGAEYRISARYTLSPNSSVKISFNTTRQYIHMLSNTTIISPTDTWKLSDTDIRPQEGLQWSAGYYRNFKENAIETSLEFYYKDIKNVLDYRSGAKLLMNQYISTDVISAKGKSYGAELMVKKVSGKLNGWVSYTYSRTLLRQNDPSVGEVINKGEYYPASFDKPHNLNIIGNYRLTHRFGLSLNFVYTTGRPITIPIAIFDLGGAQRVYYSERNQYRIPDYFRADFSVIMEGNHKVKQRTHNSWTFGVYNLTARRNPYSVYFTEVNGKIKGYQVSIFGSIIPFLTFNLKF